MRSNQAASGSDPFYAVGYSSGPQFFASLHRKTLREFALAAFLAFSALFIVVACARLFHLNKGLAAGLAAGALTQSAIVGTAGDAIATSLRSTDLLRTPNGRSRQRAMTCPVRIKPTSFTWD
ncbi:aspartate-alanine antiporter-like transporter [Paraburkholderia fungorum]